MPLLFLLIADISESYSTLCPCKQLYLIFLHLPGICTLYSV